MALVQKQVGRLAVDAQALFCLLYTSEVAGRFLARVALKKRVKPYYAIGLSYKFFVLLSRILPIRLIGWLLGLLYAGE